jgi:hypothetical protein
MHEDIRVPLPVDSFLVKIITRSGLYDEKR